MAILNPLDLPEIREALAPFLPTDDLARCIRVCTAWNASFYPFLWSAVDIDPRRKPPSTHLLHLHSASVRHLTYHGSVPHDHFSLHYPALRTLHLLSAQVRPLSTNCAFTIVSKHPTLTHVKLNGSLLHSHWVLPSGMTNLTSLSLTRIILLYNDMERIRTLVSQLETLQVFHSRLSGCLEPLKGHWKMKDLILEPMLGMTPNGQLELIKQCPQLRRLSWDLFGSCRTFPIHEFAQAVAKTTWPELEHLQLMRSRASDVLLSLIVRGMQRVVSLSITHAAFADQAMATLRPHFHWLRQLNVTRNFFDTSEFMAEILKSCPKLESLKTDGISAEYLLDDQPWACERSLKVLDVCFWIAPTSFDHHRQYKQVFRRLLKLENLERLDMSNLESPESVSTVELQLGAGLEQLSTLKRLKELVFYPQVHRLSVEDVDWMIKHWKSLESVKGSLCLQDVALSQQLIDMFSEAGINTTLTIVGSQDTSTTVVGSFNKPLTALSSIVKVL